MAHPARRQEISAISFMGWKVWILGWIWVKVTDFVAVSGDVKPVGSLIGEVSVDHRKGDQYPITIHLDHRADGSGSGSLSRCASKEGDSQQKEYGHHGQRFHGEKATFEMFL